MILEKGIPHKAKPPKISFTLLTAGTPKGPHLSTLFHHRTAELSFNIFHFFQVSSTLAPIFHLRGGIYIPPER